MGRPELILLGIFAGAIGGAVPLAFFGQRADSGADAEITAAPDIGGQDGISALSGILSEMPIILTGLAIGAVLIFILWAVSLFSRIAIVLAAEDSSGRDGGRAVRRYLDDGARFFIRVAAVDILLGMVALGATIALISSELGQVIVLVDRLPGSGIEMLRVIGDLGERFYTFSGGMIAIGGVAMVKPALLAVLGFVVGASLWGIRETAIRTVVLKDKGVLRSLLQAAGGAIRAPLARSLSAITIVLFAAIYLSLVSLGVFYISTAVYIPIAVVTVLVGVVVMVSIGFIEVMVGSFWNQYYRSECSILYPDTRDQSNDTGSR